MSHLHGNRRLHVRTWLAVTAGIVLCALLAEGADYVFCHRPQLTAAITNAACFENSRKIAWIFSKSNCRELTPEVFHDYGRLPISHRVAFLTIILGNIIAFCGTVWAVIHFLYKFIYEIPRFLKEPKSSDDPLNEYCDALPLYGRDGELQKLLEFAKSDGEIPGLKVWFLAASMIAELDAARLASHWLSELRKEGALWHGYELIRSPEDTEKWPLSWRILHAGSALAITLNRTRFPSEEAFKETVSWLQKNAGRRKIRLLVIDHRLAYNPADLLGNKAVTALWQDSKGATSLTLSPNLPETVSADCWKDYAIKAREARNSHLEKEDRKKGRKAEGERVVVHSKSEEIEKWRKDSAGNLERFLRLALNTSVEEDVARCNELLTNRDERNTFLLAILAGPFGMRDRKKIVKDFPGILPVTDGKTLRYLFPEGKGTYYPRPVLREAVMQKLLMELLREVDNDRQDITSADYARAAFTLNPDAAMNTFFHLHPYAEDLKETWSYYLLPIIKDYASKRSKEAIIAESKELEGKINTIAIGYNITLQRQQDASAIHTLCREQDWLYSLYPDYPSLAKLCAMGYANALLLYSQSSSTTPLLQGSLERLESLLQEGRDKHWKEMLPDLAEICAVGYANALLFCNQSFSTVPLLQRALERLESLLQEGRDKHWKEMLPHLARDCAMGYACSTALYCKNFSTVALFQGALERLESLLQEGRDKHWKEMLPLLAERCAVGYANAPLLYSQSSSTVPLLQRALERLESLLQEGQDKHWKEMLPYLAERCAGGYANATVFYCKNFSTVTLFQGALERLESLLQEGRDKHWKEMLPCLAEHCAAGYQNALASGRLYGHDLARIKQAFIRLVRDYPTGKILSLAHESNIF